MPVRFPVRLDHVKRAIRGVIVDALSDTLPASQVVWSEQGIPRSPRPLVALALVTGPVPDNALKAERRVRFEIDSVDFTVLTAIVGDLVRVRQNGIPFEVVVVGGDTVDTVRDRLRDLVNNVPQPQTKQTDGVTAADSGAGAFSITPDFVGAIYTTAVGPSGAISQVVNTSATDCVQHNVTRERMSFQCDVMTKGGSAFELTSRSIARRIVAAFDLESTLESLANLRVPVRVEGAINDLTAIAPAGIEYESRAQFDMMAFASSRTAEAIVPIDIVEITTDIDGNVDTFTVP